MALVICCVACTGLYITCFKHNIICPLLKKIYKRTFITFAHSRIFKDLHLINLSIGYMAAQFPLSPWGLVFDF